MNISRRGIDMVVNSNIAQKADELVKAIIESEEYKNFEEYKRIVLSDSELLKNVKRTRVIRDQLNRMSDYERNSASAEALENEYDNLADITYVHRFLLAELKVCEMYRDVMTRIVDKVDIDL